MPAPEGTEAWRETSAAAEWPPSSRSTGSKAGHSRVQRSRQAEKLATYAAGSCLAADLAPGPPDAIPREAKRQSSSDIGLSMRWLRAA